jgi:flagellar basal body-associated protein FliL
MVKQIALFVLPALIAAAAGLFLGGRYFGPAHTPAAQAKPQPVQVPLGYVELKELTVRLADTDTEHYVKISPVLAVNAKATERVEPLTPVTRDVVLMVVGAKSSGELMRPDGAAKLKQQLLGALAPVLHDDLKGIYFDEYLVE